MMVKILIVAALIAVAFSEEPEKEEIVKESELDKQQIADGIEKSAEIAKQIAEEIAKVTATLVKVANIASKIGQAFQYIGPAFALISVFLPGAEDALEKRIEEGFHQINERFDQVDQELKEIKDQILVGFSYQPYREIQDALDVLYSKHSLFRGDQKNAVYRNDMQKSCSKNDPMGKLLLLHKYVTQTGQGVDLLQAMLLDSGYNNDKLTNIFRIVIRDATRAGFLRQACLRLASGNNKATMKQDAEIAGRQIEEIFNALDRKKEEYRTTLFKVEMTKEVNASLNSMTPFIGQNVEGPLMDILTKKFSFAKWTVVYHKNSEFCKATHAVYPSQTGSYHLSLTKDDYTIFVSWSKEQEFDKLRLLKNEANRVLQNLFLDDANAEQAASQIHNAAQNRESVIVITPSNCAHERPGQHSLSGNYGKYYVAVSF